MDKQQILDHIWRIEEEERLLQTPTTALVPLFQQQTPPIVESTIVIQEPPLPEEELITNSHPPKKRRGSFFLFPLSLLLLLSVGMYFALPIFFPTATVTIVPMEKRLTTTATIHIATTQTQATDPQIPGRVFPSLTLSQAETVRTTGIGHQQATYAQGSLTFYNGLLSSQTIPEGTILTGSDGTQVMTDQAAFLPADTPPINGIASVQAHVLRSGERGNIASGDVSTALSSTILARNLQPFYGGRDARTFSVVAQADIDSAVAHLKPLLTQSIQGAFASQLTTGEALVTPSCVLNTIPNHLVGEEAKEVQVNLNETCQAAAYKTNDLQQVVSRFVDQEAIAHFGNGYALAGEMNVTLARSIIATTNPRGALLAVTVASQWVYQIGEQQQQQIRKHIAGKSKRDALALLSHMDGIEQVTLSLVGGYNNALPQDTGRIRVFVMKQLGNS